LSKKSACKSKLRHLNEEAAQQYADRSSAFHSVMFEIYRCPICDGWHTKKSKDDRLDEMVR